MVFVYPPPPHSRPLWDVSTPDPTRETWWGCLLVRTLNGVSGVWLKDVASPTHLVSRSPSRRLLPRRWAAGCTCFSTSRPTTLPRPGTEGRRGSRRGPVRDPGLTGVAGPAPRVLPVPRRGARRLNALVHRTGMDVKNFKREVEHGKRERCEVDGPVLRYHVPPPRPPTRASRRAGRGVAGCGRASGWREPPWSTRTRRSRCAR